MPNTAYLLKEYYADSGIQKPVAITDSKEDALYWVNQSVYSFIVRTYLELPVFDVGAFEVEERVK